MGRPLKEIDGEQVRKLSRLGCTYEEIGAFFDASGDTVSRRFAEEFALGREDGKTSLRRMQWKSARSGSVPMQIHLGKQYLGQSDKHDIRGADGKPFFESAKQQEMLANERALALTCELDSILAAPADAPAESGEPGGICSSGE